MKARAIGWEAVCEHEGGSDFILTIKIAERENNRCIEIFPNGGDNAGAEIQDEIQLGQFCGPVSSSPTSRI